MLCCSFNSDLKQQCSNTHSKLAFAELSIALLTKWLYVRTYCTDLSNLLSRIIYDGIPEPIDHRSPKAGYYRESESRRFGFFSDFPTPEFVPIVTGLNLIVNPNSIMASSHRNTSSMNTDPNQTKRYVRRKLHRWLFQQRRCLQHMHWTHLLWYRHAIKKITIYLLWHQRNIGGRKRNSDRGGYKGIYSWIRIICMPR